MKEADQAEGQVGAVGGVEVLGDQLDRSARLAVARQSRIIARIFYLPVRKEELGESCEKGKFSALRFG